MRILSGIQPSGKLHLGNYFGALRQFIAYQGRAETIYFIADWHALTTVRDAAVLRRNCIEVALDYLALGIDPAKTVIFRQSDVPQHAELAWILNTLAPMSLLERAHSYKDKVAHGFAASSGLFTYPVLMAADILLYSPDCVPVGQDQKQHLEITRDLCTKFNVAYVPGFDPKDPDGAHGGPPGILKLPEPLIMDEVAVVTGTDGKKMSKSYDNTLELFDDLAVTHKKIMGIKTDSTPVEAAKPRDSPLLQLLSLLATDHERGDILQSWEAGGTGYGSYKKRLIELFDNMFSEARERRQGLAGNLADVEQVLADGARRARLALAPTWNRVVEAIGTGRPVE